MFPFQCGINRVFQWRIFSYLLFVKRNENHHMTIYRLLSHSYCCMKFKNGIPHAIPRDLVSDQHEFQKWFDKTRSSQFSKRCVKKIEKSFKCSFDESLVLYKQYPHLFHECINDTLKKISLFADAGISEEILVKNIEILELGDDEIIYKIKEMNTWGLNDHQKIDMLDLLKLESKEFEKITVLFKNDRSQIPGNNRLIYFSNVLQCTLREVVAMSIEYPQLLLQRFEDTKKIFELLLDQDIRPQSLQNNLWLLDYSMETIEKCLDVSGVKIEVCTKTKREDWMNRLQKIKKTDTIDKTILKPDQTREEFLAEKLQIDLKIIEYLMSQHPKIFDRNLREIIKVIDFLYFHGYTSIQICTNFLVLNQDINLLQIRLKKFESCGNYKLPLTILSASKSKYETFLQKLFGRI